ncbi:MAG: hypothetical protein GX575_07700 [Candidatus Anammoximicrobium sp.]|nr:hypothetical protein [Candidatus Anammoximicrobium sp.]
MKWLAAVLIAVVGLCGCKSSQTPFNTLAPFGASRVPPPSTTVGATGAYYNRTATPPAATPAQPNAASNPAAGAATGQKASSLNSSGASEAWQLSPKTAGTGTSSPSPVASSQASAVRPASYAAGTAAASASGSLRLSGMPVNDATSSPAGSEPARFVASGSAVEISELPKALATPAPVTANSTAGGVVVASAQASDQPAPAASPAASTLQWRSRP